MKYYIKKSIIPLVYTVLMACVAIFFPWDDVPPWARYLISVLNIIMFAVVAVVISFKDGETAMKTLHSNDINRKRIIQTGDDIPIDRVTEYKAYKGFLIGFFNVIPMILLLIVHTFVYYLADNTIFGTIADLLYKGYTKIFEFSGIDISGSYCYLILSIIPLIVSITGIPYILGAKKMQRVYANIREQQKELYGDK